LIVDATTSRRRYCKAKCRHRHWYDQHRTPGPSSADYPELFALLEREAARYEGRLVGYSIRWLGHVATGCEFPEQGRVTRRDGVDGSVQFSDQPYFHLRQLPRLPKPSTEYRAYVWVKNGETIERVHSEWCEFKRGSRNVHFYDDKLYYYDPTGRYGTKTTQTWPRGEKRPLPPGAKRRKRRVRENSSPAPQFEATVGPLSVPAAVQADTAPVTLPAPQARAAAAVQSLPATEAQSEILKVLGTLTQRLDRIEARRDQPDAVSAIMTTEIRKMLGTLTQRLDRLDARLDQPEDASSTRAPEIRALLSQQSKMQEDVRKLQEELRSEREARAKAEAIARKEAEHAAAEKARTELLLAQATAALEHLRREGEALLARRAAQSPIASSAPSPAQVEARSEAAPVRPVGQTVAQPVARSAQSFIATPPTSSPQSVSSSKAEPAQTVGQTEANPESQAVEQMAAAGEPSAASPEKESERPSQGQSPSQSYRWRAPSPKDLTEFQKEILRQQPWSSPKQQQRKGKRR